MGVDTVSRIGNGRAKDPPSKKIRLLFTEVRVKRERPTRHGKLAQTRTESPPFAGLCAKREGWATGAKLPGESGHWLSSNFDSLCHDQENSNSPSSQVRVRFTKRRGVRMLARSWRAGETNARVKPLQKLSAPFATSSLWAAWRGPRAKDGPPALRLRPPRRPSSGLVAPYRAEWGAYSNRVRG